eukprot:scaffold11915_cov121-Isochrysis_galbana.AAC.3
MGRGLMTPSEKVRRVIDGISDKVMGGAATPEGVFCCTHNPRQSRSSGQCSGYASRMVARLGVGAGSRSEWQSHLS